MLKSIYFKQIAFFIFSPSQKIHLCIIGSVLESTMAPNSNGGKERDHGRTIVVQEQHALMTRCGQGSLPPPKSRNQIDYTTACVDVSRIVCHFQRQIDAVPQNHVHHDHSYALMQSFTTQVNWHKKTRLRSTTYA